MPVSHSENWFLLGLIAVAAILAWFVFQPYISALVLAAVLAYLFQRAYGAFVRVFHNKSIAALLVVLIVVLIVFVPLAVFTTRIVGEATVLYGSLATNGSSISDNVAHFLHASTPNVPASEIAGDLNGIAQQILAWLIRSVGSIFTGLAQFLFTAVISLIGLYYALIDGEALRQWAISHAPIPRVYAERIIAEMEGVTGSVIAGMLAVCVAEALVVGFGFWIFGVPNPAFWGALAAITTLIPVVGTWLVIVPGIGYLLYAGQTSLAIGLLIWSAVLANVAYNAIAPQFVRRRAGIHPYIVLLSVLGGISAFGPIGFLMGPFVVAFLFSLLRIYQETAKLGTARSK